MIAFRSMAWAIACLTLREPRIGILEIEPQVGVIRALPLLNGEPGLPFETAQHLRLDVVLEEVNRPLAELQDSHRVVRNDLEQDLPDPGRAFEVARVRLQPDFVILGPGNKLKRAASDVPGRALVPRRPALSAVPECPGPG